MINQAQLVVENPNHYQLVEDPSLGPIYVMAKGVPNYNRHFWIRKAQVEEYQLKIKPVILVTRPRGSSREKTSVILRSMAELPSLVAHG